MYGIIREYEDETGESQPDVRRAEGCDSPCRRPSTSALIAFLTCTNSGTKCNNLCEPKLQLKSRPGTVIVDVGHRRLFSVTVCSRVSNKPQCKGVICQPNFGISDDADVSSQSGSVTVLERQSC